MKSLKIILICIFIIIVIGVLFFTLQVVRNPGFKAPIAPQEKTDGTLKTFIDTKRGFSFSYPSEWWLMDPVRLPGYTPVIGIEQHSGEIGLIAVSQRNMARQANMNADVEMYSDDLPITEMLSSLIGSPVEIHADETKKLTYRSGMGGFIIKYSGKAGVDAEAKTVSGKIYMYYVRNEIMHSFSAYISDASAVVEKSAANVFLGQADLALQGLITY